MLRPANIDIRQIGDLLSGRYKGKPPSPEDMDKAIAAHLSASRMRKKLTFDKRAKRNSHFEVMTN